MKGRNIGGHCAHAHIERKREIYELWAKRKHSANNYKGLIALYYGIPHMATPKPAVGPILHPLKTDIVHNRLAISTPLLVHTVVKKTPQRTEGFEFSRLTLAICEGWLTRLQRSALGFRFLTPKYNTSIKKKKRELDLRRQERASKLEARDI